MIHRNIHNWFAIQYYLLAVSSSQCSCNGPGISTDARLLYFVAPSFKAILTMKHLNSRLLNIEDKLFKHQDYPFGEKRYSINKRLHRKTKKIAITLDISGAANAIQPSAL